MAASDDWKPLGWPEGVAASANGREIDESILRDIAHSLVGTEDIEDVARELGLPSAQALADQYGLDDIFEFFFQPPGMIDRYLTIKSQLASRLAK